jgi:hypothetical protein
VSRRLRITALIDWKEKIFHFTSPDIFEMLSLREQINLSDPSGEQKYINKFKVLPVRLIFIYFLLLWGKPGSL